MMTEETESQIEDYVDGRMDEAQRATFEARLKTDSELRSRLAATTRSMELIQQALGWATPGEEFERQVNTKIVSITQSGQNFRPVLAASERRLTGDDADARLLIDPEANRERKRLIMLGIVAAVIFTLAAGSIIYSITNSVQKGSAQRK